MDKFIRWAFIALVFLTLLTPFWVFTDLLFPYVTSKAFYLRIVVEVAAPLYVYLVLRRPALRPRLAMPLNAAVIAFFLISCLAALTGVNVFRSILGNFERMGGVFYLAHLTALYFYVLLLGQLGGAYMKRLLQALAGIGSVVTLVGLLGLVGIHIVPDPSLPDRISSVFGNPIYLGGFVILPLFLCLYFFFLEAGRWRKLLYVAGSLICVLGVYYSGTRGALVGTVAGLVVALFLYAIFSSSQTVRAAGIGGVALLVVVAGLLFYYHGRLPEGSRLRRIFNLMDSNTSSRLIQWNSALKGIRDNPVLGVGPENYYVISNRYFNPEIYKYDPSWFDKPHNYLLEVWATTGTMGFVAYLAMLGGTGWILVKAFREGFLDNGELAALVGGFVAYQIQNLFVFDNVSTSLQFFVFLGFAGFLWTSLRQLAPKPGTTKREPVLPGAFPSVAAGAAAVMAVIVLYVGNIAPMQAAKAVNYGYAYAAVDPEKAVEYFTRARENNWNIDPAETAGKFSDFAGGLLQSPIAQARPEFVRQQVATALEGQHRVTERMNNDPVVWQRYATVLMLSELVNGRVPGSSVEESIRTAQALSPERAELMLPMLQLRIYQKRHDEAVQIAERIASLNFRNPQYQWQLALVLSEAGRGEEAARQAETAFAKGYVLRFPEESFWLENYYREAGSYEKAIALLETASRLDDRRPEVFVRLVTLYALTGNAPQARDLAGRISKVFPDRKQEIDDLLKKHGM